MKKIFFPKSGSSNGREKKKQSRQKTVDFQTLSAENKFRNSERFIPVCDRKVTEKKTVSSSRSSVFRRSQTMSMSSTAHESCRFSEEDLSGLRNRRRFPSSHRECNCSDCHLQFSITGSKPERYNAAETKRPTVDVSCNNASCSTSNPSSPQNSLGSTSISDQVFDLYIDNDRPQDNRRMKDQSRRIPHKRVFSESHLFIPSHTNTRDSLRSEHQHESPRKLAKDVVGKLLRLEQFRDLNSVDVCDKHLDEKSYLPKDDISGKGCTLKDFLLEREYGTIFPEEDRDVTDFELRRKLEEVEHKALKLSKELSRERSSRFDNVRLKDRLRELTEHNVSLEREISAFCEKERENDNLQKMLSDVTEKLQNAEEVRFCTGRNLKQKEKENTELIKVNSRVRGICNEQEKTIEGLRQCLNSEIERREISGKLQNVTHKLQMEQSRLTEVEQVLRKQLETCTAEVTCLRTENIYLLERLKVVGEVSGQSGLRLDQELNSCVESLKSTGLSLLNESVQTCDKLLKIIRTKDTSHTVIQYDTKVQGFKHGLEQLTRSLGKASFILKEKAETTNHDTDKYKNVNRVVQEDDLVSELKAENLVTSILKEKLYSKEKEGERVQSELARVLHNHDVLKREIQDAFDTVSCLNHKLKNFELLMIEKDGLINELRGEVRSQEDEVSSTKRTLSKVSQERDLMWEEVKQYSEKNMLINRELGFLKKKIDALEEDTLLKDGQISILKDSLSNAKTFDDVLFGPNQGSLFKL